MSAQVVDQAKDQVRRAVFLAKARAWDQAIDHAKSEGALDTIEWAQMRSANPYWDMA